MEINELCERHVKELQEAQDKTMLDHTIYDEAKRYAVANAPHAESSQGYPLALLRGHRSKPEITHWLLQILHYFGYRRTQIVTATKHKMTCGQCHYNLTLTLW